MPAVIGRDELRKLTGDGAQLPVEDYEWAHLPGAVSLPLKELDGRAVGKDMAVGRDLKHILLAARTRRGRLVGGPADIAYWYRGGRWFGADGCGGIAGITR